jgi:hypothetical protein
LEKHQEKRLTHQNYVLSGSPKKTESFFKDRRKSAQKFSGKNEQVKRSRTNQFFLMEKLGEISKSSQIWPTTFTEELVKDNFIQILKNTKME